MFSVYVSTKDSNSALPTYQVIESLRGKKLKKVCAGFNYSVFLTTRGKVLSCGDDKLSGLNDSALSKYHRPQQIPFLENVTVVDVVCGDAFTIALTDCGVVYAWGKNANGQLGLDPDVYGTWVCLPTIINDISTENNVIQQISAGSAHWAAWTTPPLPPPTRVASSAAAPATVLQSGRLPSVALSTTSPYTAHLGVPTRVPAKYSCLTNHSVSDLRKRLYTLKQVRMRMWYFHI